MYLYKKNGTSKLQTRTAVRQESNCLLIPSFSLKKVIHSWVRYMEMPDRNNEKLKRAIITGSFLAGVYFFDYLTADEWFEKDDQGNFVMKRRGIIKEIFE